MQVLALLKRDPRLECGIWVSTPEVNEMENKTVNLEKCVVEGLPETLRSKGRLLIDHLKDATDLRWNERGELILSGEKVHGSNVSDLVNEIVRPQKLSTEPKCWRTFATVLKESNVPIDLIGNKARWESSLSYDDNLGSEGLKASDLSPTGTTPSKPRSCKSKTKTKENKPSPVLQGHWQNF